MVEPAVAKAYGTPERIERYHKAMSYWTRVESDSRSAAAISAELQAAAAPHASSEAGAPLSRGAAGSRADSRPALVKTPREVLEQLGQDSGGAVRVCIMGAIAFRSAHSELEELVRLIAGELLSVFGDSAVFVTCGLSGVQKTFARSCGDRSRLWNLVPLGHTSSYGIGQDVQAGLNLEERKDIFCQLGDLYIVVEGGPGVSHEVQVVHERGAGIIPVMRAGGAGSGLFNFPAAALRRPDFASEQHWDLLKRKDTPLAECAQAVAALASGFALAMRPARAPAPPAWAQLTPPTSPPAGESLRPAVRELEAERFVEAPQPLPPTPEGQAPTSEPLAWAARSLPTAPPSAPSLAGAVPARREPPVRTAVPVGALEAPEAEASPSPPSLPRWASPARFQVVPDSPATLAAAGTPETPIEAVQRLRHGLGGGPLVCLLGGRAFRRRDSEELVRYLACVLPAALGPDAVCVLSGLPGVQKVFAEHCADPSRLYNLLPIGHGAGSSMGKTVRAGATMEQRQEIFCMLGDIYVTIEGGPSVVQEAKAAMAHGATIIPVARSGGASAGQFNFPAEALERPPAVGEAEWALLRSRQAPAEECAGAVAAAVAQLLARRHGGAVHDDRPLSDLDDSRHSGRPQVDAPDPNDLQASSRGPTLPLAAPPIAAADDDVSPSTPTEPGPSIMVDPAWPPAPAPAPALVWAGPAPMFESTPQAAANPPNGDTHCSPVAPQQDDGGQVPSSEPLAPATELQFGAAGQSGPVAETAPREAEAAGDGEARAREESLSPAGPSLGMWQASDLQPSTLSPLQSAAPAAPSVMASTPTRTTLTGASPSTSSPDLGAAVLPADALLAGRAESHSPADVFEAGASLPSYAAGTELASPPLPADAVTAKRTTPPRPSARRPRQSTSPSPRQSPRPPARPVTGAGSGGSSSGSPRARVPAVRQAGRTSPASSTRSSPRPVPKTSATAAAAAVAAAAAAPAASMPRRRPSTSVSPQKATPPAAEPESPQQATPQPAEAALPPAIGADYSMTEADGPAAGRELEEASGARVVEALTGFGGLSLAEQRPCPEARPTTESPPRTDLQEALLQTLPAAEGAEAWSASETSLSMDPTDPLQPVEALLPTLPASGLGPGLGSPAVILRGTERPAGPPLGESGPLFEASLPMDLTRPLLQAQAFVPTLPAAEGAEAARRPTGAETGLGPGLGPADFILRGTERPAAPAVLGEEGPTFEAQLPVDPTSPLLQAESFIPTLPAAEGAEAACRTTEAEPGLGPAAVILRGTERPAAPSVLGEAGPMFEAPLPMDLTGPLLQAQAFVPTMPATEDAEAACRTTGVEQRLGSAAVILRGTERPAAPAVLGEAGPMFEAPLPMDLTGPLLQAESFMQTLPAAEDAEAACRTTGAEPGLGPVAVILRGTGRPATPLVPGEARLTADALPAADLTDPPLLAEALAPSLPAAEAAEAAEAVPAALPGWQASTRPPTEAAPASDEAVAQQEDDGILPPVPELRVTGLLPPVPQSPVAAGLPVAPFGAADEGMGRLSFSTRLGRAASGLEPPVAPGLEAHEDEPKPAIGGFFGVADLEATSGFGPLGTAGPPPPGSVQSLVASAVPVLTRPLPPRPLTPASGPPSTSSFTPPTGAAPSAGRSGVLPLAELPEAASPPPAAAEEATSGFGPLGAASPPPLGSVQSLVASAVPLLTPPLPPPPLTPASGPPSTSSYTPPTGAASSSGRGGALPLAELPEDAGGASPSLAAAEKVACLLPPLPALWDQASPPVPPGVPAADVFTVASGGQEGGLSAVDGPAAAEARQGDGSGAVDQAGGRATAVRFESFLQDRSSGGGREEISVVEGQSGTSKEAFAADDAGHSQAAGPDRQGLWKELRRRTEELKLRAEAAQVGSDSGPKQPREEDFQKRVEALRRRAEEALVEQKPRASAQLEKVLAEGGEALHPPRAAGGKPGLPGGGSFVLRLLVASIAVVWLVVGLAFKYGIGPSWTTTPSPPLGPIASSRAQIVADASRALEEARGRADAELIAAQSRSLALQALLEADLSEAEADDLGGEAAAAAAMRAKAKRLQQRSADELGRARLRIQSRLRAREEEIRRREAGRLDALRDSTSSTASPRSSGPHADGQGPTGAPPVKPADDRGAQTVSQGSGTAAPLRAAPTIPDCGGPLPLRGCGVAPQSSSRDVHAGRGGSEGAGRGSRLEGPRAEALSSQAEDAGPRRPQGEETVGYTACWAFFVASIAALGSHRGGAATVAATVAAVGLLLGFIVPVACRTSATCRKRSRGDLAAPSPAASAREPLLGRSDRPAGARLPAV